MLSHPLRIVYFIGQLGLGGSERQLYLLLKNMDKTCFELHVVVFNPSPNNTLDDDLRKAGVSVHPIPDGVKGIPARMLWIFRLLVYLKPHVIHSWSIHDNIYAGLVGWLAHVPRRLGSVRDSLNTPDFQHFSFPIRWLILNCVQGLLVNSDQIVAEVQEYGISSHRIHMLSNCVDTDSQKLPIKIPGVSGNVRLVGLVANLRSKKNHKLFVRGLAQILPEFPDVLGIMVGQPVLVSDPDVPDQIQGEMDNLGVGDRVRMLGFHSNVPALLRGFDVFCLTSDYEGTPNAVLEAMAAGLPVIATRVGGIPRLVQDGVNGFLIEPGDVHGLAEALRVLLRDPQRARQMGAAGRQRAEVEFCCDVLVPRFEQYYLDKFAQ